MKYRLLGKSGLKVSEIALGAMTFGMDWGWGADRTESRSILDFYVDQGGNFVDTAVNYTNGTSETWLGEFLEGRRDSMVLATKYTLSRDPKDPNACGNSRKNMISSLEASLRRLKTDYVDLYSVHAWDGLTPLEEVMRGLDDLVRAGKVRYLGVSDSPAWVVARSNTMAELRGWTSFVALQTQYNLIERTSERELLPMCAALDIAVTAWAPLAAGVLTGKYNIGQEGPKRLDPGNPWSPRPIPERSLAIAQRVLEIATELDTTATRVALAWILHQRVSGTVIPIVGARTPKQLEDTLLSVDVKLSPDHLQRINDISAPVLGFPHDFLQGEAVRTLIHGQAKSRVHRDG